MSKAYILDIFGENVFNEQTMEKLLPEDVFLSLKRTMKDGCPLSDGDANVFAETLKKWAMEKGATHYTHWFQPMTGVTAEKHESFISPNQEGSIITKFRGKELIKGEPDASSFPNGGIRATFEARGYTAWDPTSYAFIKDNTLCIPTAFCSYSGEILDKKTPLLKSNQALNKQALRILRLFKSDASHVKSTVGAEQEYFLIDKDVFLKRKDLLYTGRTLFGAKPPKGQELDDHYFGIIKPRVAAFMKEADEELWKLGIVAKTEHNEVAPAQHELAPGYTQSNIACDQNQLTMEMLKKVADRHGMTCLLHEKPFAGINGSGKHINWSMLTDTDVNLLEPGATPQDNAQFLLFLAAVVKAADEYQDLLRVTVASAGNDHRLGANEAPPAIISVFIGSDLEEVVDAIVRGDKAKANQKRQMHIGVDALPLIPADATDRNRTSPLAFTGNKFEFRMPGSSFSIADPTTVINTVVAESLAQFADRLEKADDFTSALGNLIAETFRKHGRVIFNGNNYSEEWVEEAEKRGLLNIVSTAEAIPLLSSEKNVKLFTEHGIFTQREIAARQEILLENYCKTINIEALTALEMVKREILPAVEKYCGELVKTAKNKDKLFIDNSLELKHINALTELLKSLDGETDNLENLAEQYKQITDSAELAEFCREKIVTSMNKLRGYADKMETLCPDSAWPMPDYGDLLYSVH